MKFINFEFEGRDAHAVSTFICMFEQQFKENPTDAAHELHRNLTFLADSPQREYKRLAVRDDNILPFRDRRGNGLSRSAHGRTGQR
jgi:hypothetical protein